MGYNIALGKPISETEHKVLLGLGVFLHNECVPKRLRKIKKKDYIELIANGWQTYTDVVRKEKFEHKIDVERLNTLMNQATDQWYRESINRIRKGAEGNPLYKFIKGIKKVSVSPILGRLKAKGVVEYRRHCYTDNWGRELHVDLWRVKPCVDTFWVMQIMYITGPVREQPYFLLTDAHMKFMADDKYMRMAGAFYSLSETITSLREKKHGGRRERKSV